MMKKARVMIACVSDEVVAVVQPAIQMDVDRIHLVNFVKEKDTESATEFIRQRANFYMSVLEAVKGQLPDSMEIEEHNELPTYLIKDMIRVVNTIIDDETSKGSTIYVNLTSGTKEFCAGAAIASMMHQDVNIFTLGAKQGSLTIGSYDERLKTITDKDGKVVGTHCAYHDPFPVERIPIDPPDENLLKSLKVFDAIPLKHRVNTIVIRNLILNGLWLNVADIEPGTELTTEVLAEGTSYGIILRYGEKPISPEFNKLANRECVRYQRNFIDRWTALGWIEYNQLHKKYDVTGKGKMNLDVFCHDFEVKDLDLLRY